jgi:hypothetical protein
MASFFRDRFKVVKLLPMAISYRELKNSEAADGQGLARKTLYAFKQQITKVALGKEIEGGGDFHSI